MSLQYLPDALPGIPGVISSGNGLLPTGRGYANIQSLVQYGGASGWTVPATPNSLWVNDFETYGRVLAGTATAIYELGLTGYSTYSATARLSGMTAPSYAAGTFEQSDPNHWVFANYGQVVLATNKFVGSLYAQTTKGVSFSAVSGSPAAGCMVVWKNFVICGNVGNYGAVTGTQDLVAWSALSDYTDWVPSNATQAGWQRLLDVPGRIVAMAPLGDALAIYKADCIYLMWYVGGDNIFAFQLVDGERGCNASFGYPPPVTDIGKAHLFMSRNDVCLFDGSNLKSIAVGRVQRTMLESQQAAGGILPGTHLSQDSFNGLVHFWRYGLIYNYLYDQWGPMPTTYNATPIVAANYSSAWHVDLGSGNGVINNAQTLVAKGDGLIYNYWLAFHGTAQTATYENMVFNFSPIGANDFSSTLRRLYLLFSSTNPTGTPTLSYSRKVALGATAVADGSGTWDSTKAAFDLMKDAYWHVLSLTISSSEQEELVAMEFDLARDGKRVEAGLRRL